MKNKYVYISGKIQKTLIGMKIHFCTQDEEENEEDPEPKSFYKSADRRKSYLSASFKQIERCYHHPQPHPLLSPTVSSQIQRVWKLYFFNSLIRYTPNRFTQLNFFSYAILYPKNSRKTSFFQDFSILRISHTWMKF